MNTLKIIVILLLVAICKNGTAQSKFKITELSASAYNTQYGLPFIRFAPIHPGIEMGATFLEKNKVKSYRKISGRIGFYHHDLLANGVFIKAIYDYQVKIKNILGVGGYGGIGYTHLFYPGDGYTFDTPSGNYKSSRANQAFFLSNIGLGINYIKPKKLQPFIKYEMTMSGFNVDYIQTNFHIGLNIRL